MRNEKANLPTNRNATKSEIKTRICVLRVVDRERSIIPSTKENFKIVPQDLMGGESVGGESMLPFKMHPQDMIFNSTEIPQYC